MIKYEFDAAEPSYLTEEWPGQLQHFSWLQNVVSLPQTVFVVTTRKENGAPNANLHAWGMLAGDRGNYTSLLALLDSTHTCANIQRDGEWCLNFPPFGLYRQCFATIHCNEAETDEIAAAGLTAEPAKLIGAPRIAECPLALECRLAWERPLQDGSGWRLFAGRVVHIAAAEELLAADEPARLRALDMMYYSGSPLDPRNGVYGEAVLSMPGRAVAVQRPDGSLKEPRELVFK